MNKIKKMWKSRVVWFNSLAASVIVGLPFVADSIPQMQAFLPNDYYRWIGGIIVGANILLRFKTNKALDEK